MFEFRYLTDVHAPGFKNSCPSCLGATVTYVGYDDDVVQHHRLVVWSLPLFLKMKVRPG